MGIKYSFIDSTVYGTDDINDITRSLTGAGVAPFVSKESYDGTDLNILTSALVDSGVQLDGCKCTVYNPGTADMTVTVAQGIIFFESGVRLEVDEQGYTIAVAPNAAGHIYARYSPSLQKADIVFDADLPTDGEYVLLAELSLDGILSDKRVFARSKVATLGKNVMLKKQFTLLENPVLYKEGDGEALTIFQRYNQYIISKVSGVDVSRFNYAVIAAFGGTDVYFPQFGFYTGFFDVNTNIMNFVMQNSDIIQYNSSEVFFTYGELGFSISVIGNEMCVICAGPEDEVINRFYSDAQFKQFTATIM